MERRLSAIMAADVVGYSRLMGANEVGTLTALNHRRTEVIEPRITKSNGRIVKLTGDGMLIEFPSVVNAVECALAVQHEMKRRNVEIPEDRRIELRIGIHLGDVIVEDGDIFGDGVNVAARIENVGRPGGVAVSAAVKDNVGNRLDVGFEDMGDYQLKNIAQLVRVYSVGASQAPAVGENSGAQTTPAVAPDADAKPSIAVLPFDNMSRDPDQEFFSDGITEDIITDLSKISGLFVVGRNTSFSYKGKSVQLRQVAAELGVKFLLEGSVRKAGERVRVTGQLIDGLTGGHLWADRFDRDLTDIFAIQDEITKTIVAQLKIRLLPEEEEAIGHSPTANVEAYTYFLKGRQFFHNSTRVYLTMARRMFSKAVALDPRYARAYAGIASCDSRLNEWYGVAISTEEILATTDKALVLEPDLAEAHAARGVALADGHRHAEAEIAFERALALDPNSYDANFAFARYSVTEGRLDRAAQLFIRALEIQPEDSQSPLLVQTVLRAVGRADEAERYARLGLKRAEEALNLHPESSRPAQLGACAFAALGEFDRATEWLERALAIEPDDVSTRYNAACTYSLMGETDRALDLLEAWAEDTGPESKRWFRRDADLDPLRDHPRFQKLLELTEAG